MKNKNTIIISLILTIIIFIGLVFLILLYFLPNILSIEDKKIEVNNLKKDYNKIIVKGFDYNEFKKIKGDNITTYKKNILGKITPDFFNKNFINDGKKFKLYKDFLVNLDSTLKGELKEQYNKRQEEVFKILPIYTDNIIGDDKGKINDFKFVNKIEGLLYKYNLSTNSPIGIRNLEKVKEYSNSNNGKSDLGSDIYLIKLPLEISGKKKDIISFLEYIYFRGNVVKVLDNNKKEYTLSIKNASQFSEVSSISMDKYIDSSPSVNLENKNKNLIEIIKTTNQKNDYFKVNLTLLFYVQGLPNYKLKEFIINTLGKLTGNNIKDNKLQRTNYEFIRKRLKKLLILYKKDLLKYRQLNEINSYMLGINKKISAMIKSTNNNINLVENYKQVLLYKGVFEIISNKLDILDVK